MFEKLSKKNFVILLVILTALPLAVYLVKQAVKFIPRAVTGAVEIFFIPDTASLPPDTTFALDIDAKSNKIGFVRMEVDFDNSKINLVAEIQTTDKLKTVISKTSMSQANSTGHIVVVLGLSPEDKGNPPTGVFEFMRMTFGKVAGSGSTNITVNDTGVQIVDLDANELAFTSSSATVTLSPGPTATYTPTPTEGPTPTFTKTPTPTNTKTPTPTFTKTPTPNPERAACEVDPNGTWKTFDSSCADYCWSYISLRPCALVLTKSCDCGPNYCWTGQKCEQNPVPTIPQITPTPTPTCLPRPSCLDSVPACKMPEPVGGWCPTPTPTPTCQPRPLCLDIRPHPCEIPEPVGGWCQVTPTPTKKPTQTPTPVYLAGDIDGDGDVDIFDYNLLVGNFGSTGCANVADINSDCKVDIFDYNILVENFGRSS